MKDLSPESSNIAYRQLRTLYGISKLLSTFESIEITFPKILALTAESFPLKSAVLIEHWDGQIKTSTWYSGDATDDQGGQSILNARHSYFYLTGNSELETDVINEESASKQSQALIGDDLKKFISLPLILDLLPAFGILQLQGADTLDEIDLEFVGALTDLIAVALDRYYKTKTERKYWTSEARESSITISRTQHKVMDLETERSLREGFVSLLTHDLRNPLSAAMMAAELILRKSDSSESSRNLAQKIFRSIKTAQEMITNLLDANLIKGGGKLPLRKKSFSLNLLIQETVESLVTVNGERFDFDSQEDITCFWDPNGIRRIIENLCNNAIKYGFPQTRIILAVLKDKNDFVHISVNNQGDLISPEDQASIFDQFRRTETALLGTKKGWGIGLTLVRGVAMAHGGSAKVESTVEKGTTFTVVLPLDSRFMQRS